MSLSGETAGLGDPVTRETRVPGTPITGAEIVKRAG